MKAILLLHNLDWNIHANIYADMENKENMTNVEEFQRDLAMIAIRHDGSVSAEHGIGLEKMELLKMEHRETGNEDALRLMKSIKTVLDPNMIMNRGKMFD